MEKKGEFDERDVFGDADRPADRLGAGRRDCPGGFRQNSSGDGKTALLAEAERQLTAYFAGELREFSLPLKPAGTDFQRKVWDALREIPYGETRSYAEIAARVGCPRGYRAVGLANNRNPIPILIPCHRVVGANGALTGYAGGLAVKEALLRLEGVRL